MKKKKEKKKPIRAGSVSCGSGTLSPCPAPYQLETDRATDTFNFMVYVNAACPRAHFINGLLAHFLGVA